MIGLIAGLALPVLVAFAAIALGSMAAADGPVVVANANPDLAELDRVYGTYTSQWNGIVERELGATSHRNYGTYTSQWNGIVDHELGANPVLAEPDRVYGTYTSQWSGIVDRKLGANPVLAEPDRNYGTFAGTWYTDLAAR